MTSCSATSSGSTPGTGTGSRSDHSPTSRTPDARSPSCWWADSATTIERCFERGTLREFDHRLMFQLSANDSSMLMDATDAASLGTNRALLYSEERGSREKCLPYRIPRSDWLATLPGR